MFKNFCLGKLKSNPWSELDGLQPETKIIDEKLGDINMKGFLTINSQPAVNGEKSDSPTVGKSLILAESPFNDYPCAVYILFSVRFLQVICEVR